MFDQGLGRAGKREDRALDVLLLDQDWRSQAVCAQSDPDLWFSPGAVEHREAKKICRECPVRRQCLAYAMEAPVDHGVWGGLTERERRRRRRLGLPASA